MAAFMGSKITGLGGKLVNVVYIEGVIGVSTVDYDFALKFPAFAKQINEGKGSETNPITMEFKVRLPFLEWVEKCWKMYNNLKSGSVTHTELSCAIHDQTKQHTSAEIESFIAALKELEHPLTVELKNEMKHREAGFDWDRLASGSGTSTSGD